MRRIILAAALLFSLPALAGPQVKGKFDLFLNGVNKGFEKFKIETKKGELLLSSEVRFKIPMEKAKRKYIELYLYPALATDPATGKFLQYSYRVTFNDYSKTDMVEAQDSATEFLDQDWRTYDLFNRQAQLQEDEMANRIDLGVNSGKIFPIGKTLHFEQTRFSDGRVKDEALPDEITIIDAYTFCPYIHLAKTALAMSGPSHPLTLVLPQAMSLRSGTLEAMGVDQAPFRGRTLLLKHFDVLIEDGVLASFWLDQKGEVVLVVNPHEGLVASRDEYEPVPFEREAPRMVRQVVEAGGAFREERVRIPSGSITIGATLTLPQGEGPFPAVLMVQDLAPLDRDGNDPSNPYVLSGTWKQLAAALAGNGVASLRYDARGVGESGGDVHRTLPGERAADAQALYEWLKARPEAAPGRVGLLSQGLGGWIAAAVASRVSPAALAALAYPAKPLARLWKEQVGTMADPQNRQTAYTELSAVEGALQTPTEEWATFRGAKVYLPAVRELWAVDPLALAGALRIPCLFAYPERGLVIQAFHADVLAPALHEGQEVRSLPGVGHYLTAQETEGGGSGVVDGKVSGEVAEWLKKAMAQVPAP
ncbi:MAG: alpha/beta hydrolase family protein [Acidobacteriota bacterium]